ncbi:MAG: helix-turn-helix transcriptional regulator [Ruminococcaceae bacterium]|nr:helix-turn-helix transcriptional regulator [Oscillospiraceae bacterium]
MKIYDKILYCRKKVGMSQETLAEKLGVSRQAISKWECGSAAPEIENLLAISKLFGVSTDWLLNDEEGIPFEEEEVNEEVKSENNENQRTEQNNAPYTSSRRAERGNEEWMNNLPRSLGRGAKRFGWLLGVVVSCIGAGIAGLGGIIKFIVNRMVVGMSETMSSFSEEFPFGSSKPQIIGGEDLPADVADELFNQIYGSHGPAISGWDTGSEMFSSFAEYNPVSIVAGIMIVIGIIMIIGGIVLAIYLRHLSKKSA